MILWLGRTSPVGATVGQHDLDDVIGTVEAVAPPDRRSCRIVRRSRPGQCGKMSERTNWKSVPRPDAGRVRDVVEDEARITAFRELVYQLRVDAGLTQVELARRMGTTQSAIARMENGGTRPTLETLERVAGAVDQELAVVVGTRLIENRSIAKMVRSGHAVVRKAS